MEGKDRPQWLGKKEYNELVKTAGLMLRMCRPIFVSGKSVLLESGFFVAKNITKLKAKGVYATALIKNRRYWLKLVTRELIDDHFEDK